LLSSFCFILFFGKLVPKAISIFGIVAIILMFISVLLSIFNIPGGSNLMLPIGLIQLFFPFWLIFKGFKTTSEHTEMKIS
jgi:hypothetical protein